MNKPSVTIAVPTTEVQHKEWWARIMGHSWRWATEFDLHGPLAGGAAMPDVAKNIIAAAYMNGNNHHLTAQNRNAIANRFETDWLFFIDQDTVPPPDALARLFAHNRPFVCGVYYHRNDPHAPLLYKRLPNGLYNVIKDFEQGAIFQGDGYATGLGCALIHRSVFEAITQQYRVFMQDDGSRKLVHIDDIRSAGLPAQYRGGVFADRDRYFEVRELAEVPPEVEENSDFPFFEMNYGRTEDLGFCERASRVGYPVLIDTAITCLHWHMFPITERHFTELRDALKISGTSPSTIQPEGKL
jgi:hypothetical protein